MHNSSIIEAPVDIDRRIVYMARVSSPNQDNPEYEKLLSYLIRQGHWSPFDMLNVVFEVETSKDISIQILRHRSLAVQEFSMRYADASEMIGSDCVRTLRMQDATNRQNSIEVTDEIEMLNFMDFQKEYFDDVSMMYKSLLEHGVAKEVARALLPMATKTRMYLNGSVRSWLFYCKARMDASSQKEHRILAKSIWDNLSGVAPLTCAAFAQEFSLFQNAGNP